MMKTPRPVRPYPNTPHLRLGPQLQRLTCGKRLPQNMVLFMGFPAQAGSSGPAPSLSPQDRFLIEKSEEAIHDGKQLDEWIRAQFSTRALRLFPLDLKRDLSSA